MADVESGKVITPQELVRRVANCPLLGILQVFNT